MEDLGTSLIFTKDSKELFEDWYRSEILDTDNYNFALEQVDRFKDDSLTFREVADRINLLTNQATVITDDTHVKPDSLAFILRHLHDRFKDHPDKESLFVLLHSKGKEMAPLGNVPVAYLVASALDEINTQKKLDKDREMKENQEKRDADEKVKQRAELKKRKELEEEKPQDRRTRANLFAKRFENLLMAKRSTPLVVPDSKSNDDSDNDTH